MSTTLDTTSQPSAEPKVASKQFTFVPAFDIWESADRVILQGDIPGVEPGDLDVRFEDGILKLSAKVASRLPGSGVVRSEYGVGNYERQFALGDDIDSEKITAELSQGVITIELPIAEKAKPRKIEIQSR
jgi:HSP20 family protein